MNATTSKKRTAICDRESLTGVTSDDKQVEFSTSQWRWMDAETGKTVVIGGGITWITLRNE